MPRGQHKQGDFAQNDEVRFENEQGDVEEEIDLVKRLKNFSKEQTMMKNIRSAK